MSIYMKLLIPIIGLFSTAILAETATVEKQTTVKESDQGQTRIETVEQKITSTSEADTAVSDTAITSAVKSAIAIETSLAPFAINVDTKDKIVTLQGKVDTWAQLEMAVMTAASIKGVENVRSDGLTLKGEEIPSPAIIIIGNVKGALVREGLMTKEEAIALPLRVEVDQGVISVSGSLASEEMKTFVLKSIDTTASGKSVTSKITVINEPQ